MWKFWGKQGSRELSSGLQQVLIQEYGLASETVARLRVLERSSRYSGRKVTAFRVYDPAAVATKPPSSFIDLDEAAVLYAGHVEKEGQIVLAPPRQQHA